MSKNVFAYSFRFMAVLMAAVMFASCEKDTFTEANALNLELRKLRVQDSIANVKRVQDQKNAIQLLQYIRQIDSLTAIDAGGKVFYTVVPVSATNAAWTAGGDGVNGGGRSEGIQGLEGATVTISQYGQVIEAQGSKNGVYAFPVLHSGEVTVTIKAANHGTVNYVSNLTPDGPVANGKIVYVGNVIAMFETSTDAAKMATIEGKAWVETDLTNGVEEVPQGASLTANIDAAHASFRKRFINEFNGVDEAQGVTSSNQGSASTTRSGFIQKMAYESAVTRTTVGSDGTYKMLAPATGAGLPIKMEFSEFAADRTFYREGQKVTARFVYGPNVKSDVVPYGGDIPTLTFKAFTTEATATGTYVKATTGSSYLKDEKRNAYWGLGLGTTTLTGATGSGATVTATLGGADGRFDGFKTAQVNISNGGTGYTGDGTIVMAFTDHLTLGSASQIAGSSNSGIANYIRIKNGGSGFIPTVSQEVSTSGAFTNLLPTVRFLYGTTTPQGISSASATVVIDQTVGAASFISVVNGGSGYTQAPDVSFQYAVPNVVTITSTRNLPLFQLDATGQALQFITTNNIPLGTTRSNIEAAFGALTTNFANVGLAPGKLDFANGTNSKYTFVPSVGISATSNNNSTVPTFTNGQFTVVVDSDVPSRNLAPTLGSVKSISVNGGNYSSLFEANLGPNGGNAFSTALRADISLSISLIEPTNTLSAYKTELLGSGLNNYDFSPNFPATAPTGSQAQFGNVGPYSFNFTNYGSDAGNTNQNIVTTAGALDLLTASETIVVAAAPTATVANPRRAWGVPVYHQGAIAGIRLLYGGSGYVSGTASNIEIMPNPFYRPTGTSHVTIGGTRISLVDGSTTIAADYDQVGDVALAQVIARYTDAVATKTAKWTDVKRVNTPAKLTVTLSNQGSNYAGTPVIAIYAGDRLVSQTVSIAVQNEIKVVEGGKVALKDAATNDNVGVLTRTWDLTDAQDNDFDVHGITTVKVFIFDRLSGALTKEFADRVAGNPATGVAPSAAIELTQDGKVEGIYLNTRRNAQGMIEAKNNTPMATRVDWNYAPTVTVSAPSTTGGVTATAAVLISTDNGNSPGSGANNGTNFSTVGTSINGEIYGFTVSNGGSGYAPGNRFYNRGVNKGNLVGTVDFNGQDFRVIGGINNAGSGIGNNGTTNGATNTGIGDNGANGNDYHDRTESNIRFDVFTGISYVRDIHYGTGKEVE